MKDHLFSCPGYLLISHSNDYFTPPLSGNDEAVNQIRILPLPWCISVSITLVSAKFNLEFILMLFLLIYCKVS